MMTQPLKRLRHTMLLLCALILVGCELPPPPEPEKQISIPATPQNLEVQVDFTTLALTWEASEDAEGYSLYWNTSGEVSKWDQVIEVEDAAEYLHEGLKPGTGYAYRVSAWNELGESELSAEVSAKARPRHTKPTPPRRPQKFRARAGDGEVLLSWAKNPRTDGYRLYWNKRGPVSTQDEKIEVGEAIEYRHRGLKNTHTYYYAASAFNAVGESRLTGTIAITPCHANPRTDWTRTQLPTLSHIRSITQTESGYIAVGDHGAVLVSEDGRNWREGRSGTTNTLSKVIWDGRRALAVGSGGTIISSADGLDWQASDAGTIYELRDIAWTGKRYVAVGDDGVIISSADTRQWRLEQSTTSNNLIALLWTGKQLVAVGDFGTLLTSGDGRSWKSRDSETNYHLNGLAWTGKQAIVVGDYGTIITSENASQWQTHLTSSTEHLTEVTWNKCQAVAVGHKGTILLSTNGKDWGVQGSDFNHNLHDILWDGEHFLSSGDNATVMLGRLP